METEAAPTYEDLRSIVVDAIRYVTTGQDLEEAADEALTRLRKAGLAIPEEPTDE